MDRSENFYELIGIFESQLRLKATWVIVFDNGGAVKLLGSQADVKRVSIYAKSPD